MFTEIFCYFCDQRQCGSGQETERMPGTCPCGSEIVGTQISAIQIYTSPNFQEFQNLGNKNLGVQMSRQITGSLR